MFENRGNDEFLVRSGHVPGKNRKLDSAIRRIFSYLKPYKKEFFLVALTLWASTAVGFFQPLVIQIITDDGMLQQDMAVIVRLALVLAGLVLVNQAIEL